MADLLRRSHKNPLRFPIGSPVGVSLCASALPLAAVLFFVSASCNRPAQIEADAARFCDSLETEFESANADIGSALWRNTRNGVEYDSLHFKRKTWFERLNSMEALARIDKSQRESNDSLTAQRLKVSRKRILGALLENDPEISLIVDSLRRGALQELAKSPASFPELKSDTIPLLYRRREIYRQVSGAQQDFSSEILRLTRLRNQSCQNLGYNSLLDLNLSFSGITRDELNRTLAEIDSATVGQYKRLLKRIADTLSHRRLEEADIYFYELRVVSRFRRDFSRSDALDFALQTVTGLGIDIRYKSVFVDSATGLVGAPFLVAPHPPEDIRLLYRTSFTDAEPIIGVTDIENLLMQLGESAQLLSAGDKSYLLRQVTDPLWRRCLGELFVSLLDRRELQRTFARIPRGEFELFEASVADTRLLKLRRLLALVRLELALYDNPNRDLTEVYRKIVSDILYVKADKQYQYWTGRRELLMEPATQFGRLYSLLVSAQIYSTALREFGTLANNPLFGDYLQKTYFAYGARHDWPELILLGTGERLDSKYFLDRFSDDAPAQ
jgi:hypothetical protein